MDSVCSQSSQVRNIISCYVKRYHTIIYQADIDRVIALGQTETLREDGTRIRTVGKARPWVLEQIPTSVDRRPNNSGIRI